MPALNAFVGNSMGAVGAPWVVDGIAPTRRAETASPYRLDRTTRPGDGVDGRRRSLSALRLAPTAGAELSQPTLLTTPHPA